MKAMILAAGLGTRLKPFTDHHPKALAQVHGKPLLQSNIEYLASYGITDIVVNVHHFASQIVDFLKRNDGFGSRIHISDETDAVLETGGGILKAAPLLQSDEPVVVMNVDILTDLNLDAMLAFHHERNPLATLAVSDRDTSRYFLFDENMGLCGWKNIRTGEERISRSVPSSVPKAFSGIQIISQELFSRIRQRGKFSLVDVYLDLAAQYDIAGFDHTGSKFADVGRPESIDMAEKLFSA